MKIELTELRLLNFKGTKKRTYLFDPETNISGDNATGKTTIVDAFLWLLFGKDSFDRKDFNIKTLDSKNNAIEKLPHEVEGLLLIDGRPISLKRTFSEKWQKKRGSAIEEFTGHETGYFIDGITCSQKEFQVKVDEICAEQLFKLITNPAYFPSQKKEVQRQILISMAGEITDAEIAGTNQDFSELLNELSGRTLEDFKKIIGSKKKMIKDSLSGIPDRIDEVKRNMPEMQDWEVINGMISANETEIKGIETQLLDISKQYEKQHETRSGLVAQVNGLKTKKSSRIFEIVEQKSAERNRLLSALNSLKNTQSENKAELKRKENNIETLTTEKSRVESDIEKLRENWQSEFAKTITFNDNDFHCPTCKREFETSDVDSKKQNLTANFNSEKERKLKEITSKGTSLKTRLEELTASLTRDMSSVTTLNESIADYQLQIEAAEHVLPNDQDYNMEASKLPEILNIDTQIAFLNITLDAPIQVQGYESLDQRKALLQSQNKELNSKLALKEIIESSENRIIFLENENRTLSQELADYEKKEFNLSAFFKAKITEVEKRTNSMFKLVKFKLFETQINGGEVETCEAMVNGVPYSDLNNGMKINAGLDIINALCSYHSINAPIFIDNAESINEIISTNSQMIRLIVTRDKELKFS